MIDQPVDCRVAEIVERLPYDQRTRDMISAMIERLLAAPTKPPSLDDFTLDVFADIPDSRTRTGRRRDGLLNPRKRFRELRQCVNRPTVKCRSQFTGPYQDRKRVARKRWGKSLR